MITDQFLVVLVQSLFLACLALCFWKKLWIALGVLVAVIVAANALFFAADSLPLALLTSSGGLFLVFPIAVYMNLQSREREERRSTIRRSRRRTGRE